MAKYMSELGEWRRLSFSEPRQHAGIRIHEIGHDGRDSHNPIGHPHWTRPTYGLVFQLRPEGFFESAANAWRATTAGDAFICLPGIWHNYGPQPGATWEEFFCFFDGPVIDSLAGLGLLDQRQQHRHLGLEPWFLTHCAELLRCCEGPRLYEASDRLFALLSRLLHQARTHDQAHGHGLDLAGIAAAIAEQPGHDWSFRALAHDLGLSYERFRKAFKERYALPPAAYLQRERMHRACQLLAEGRRVAEVCSLVGMNDPFHFSRQFKRLIGRSPRAFAQDLRRGPDQAPGAEP